MKEKKDYFSADCFSEYGAMAVAIGLDTTQFNDLLDLSNLKNIDVANENSSIQTVISGSTHDIEFAQNNFEDHDAILLTSRFSAGYFERNGQAPSE